MEGFVYTESNNHSCAKCGKQGYFKAGLCVQCRPKCVFCGKPILRYRGDEFHPKCKKRPLHRDGDLIPVLVHG